MATRPNKASFSVQKCREHLVRAMTSYRLGLKGLENTDPARLGAELGVTVDATRATSKMQEVLARSHFLLLKVNFELLLQLLAREAWSVMLHEHRAGAKLTKSAAARLKEVALLANDLIAVDDTIAWIAESVVPIHGLDKLHATMKDAGIDLQGAWNEKSPTIWAQVNTAFAIRHLIEHRNGRVDSRFRRSVERTWPLSSWGRRADTPLEKREKVEVLEDDLKATQARMLEALEAIEPAAADVDARRRAIRAPG